MAIRVVFADDSYLIREAVTKLLASHGEIELLATCPVRFPPPSPPRYPTSAGRVGVPGCGAQHHMVELSTRLPISRHSRG
jgi:hypothetical protein